MREDLKTNCSLSIVLSKPGLSNLFSPECHQQGQESGKEDRSRTRVWKERIHLVFTGGWGEAEDHRGDQPPGPPGGSRASVASPALGLNLDTWAVTNVCLKAPQYTADYLGLRSPIANLSAFPQKGKANSLNTS